MAYASMRLLILFIFFPCIFLPLPYVFLHKGKFIHQENRKYTKIKVK